MFSLIRHAVSIDTPYADATPISLVAKFTFLKYFRAALLLSTFTRSLANGRSFKDCTFQKAGYTHIYHVEEGETIRRERGIYV